VSRLNTRELVDAGRRLAEGYRLLFGIGAVAVVLAQIVLTTSVTGWAEPWLGSLALTVAVLGIVAMLSSERRQAATRLWLTWALGCAAGLASFAIVAWRAEVDSAVAWPTATLAGIAATVVVGFSEATPQDTPDEASTARPALEPERGWPSWLTTEGARPAVTLALAAATLVLHAWQVDADWYQPTRIIVGSLYVILIPGWHLSSLIDGNRLDFIERGTLAVVLSLVAVPLGLMWVNFLGGQIDFWAVWAVVLALAVLSALLRRARLALSAATQRDGPAGSGSLLALWNARSITEKAVLLSVLLWLIAVGGLATRVGL
jgi:uncharacterized membrane protein